MDQVATSSCSNVDSGCTRDYASEFTTTEMFKSKEDLTNWAKKIGRSNNFTIVVLRSDSMKSIVTLGCERSGKCDSRSSSKKTVMGKSGRRQTVTKKCGCRFRLMGKKVAAGDEWELKVVVGMHNHDAGHPGKGHSFLGRLSQEEKSLIKNIWDDQPKEILSTLKERDEHNKSTARTIYNEVQSERRRRRQRQISGLQELMSKAEEYSFIEKHRTSPKMDTVSDFFVTLPTSLELLRAFPTVLKIVMMHWDNRVRVTTLGIYGVTSTDVDFYVGMGILFSNDKSRYEWALTSLRGVMNDYGIAMPDIVFFDTSYLDEIQMAAPVAVKAIKDVFSTAKLLLDRGSMYFNGRGYICNKVSQLNREERYSFGKKWSLLVESRSKDDFEQHVKQLRTEFDKYAETVEYFIDTFLEPYKEMFVPAWTDQVMHFGNTYEIEHDRDWKFWKLSWPFIEYLGSNKVFQQTEIDKFWKDIHSRIKEDHADIKGLFEESLENEYDDAYGFSELKELYGAISIRALELIEKETMRATKIGDEDSTDCSCAIRSTHGLPCAHVIAGYKRQGRPVPLECIHSYWRKLDFEPLRKTGDPNNAEERVKRRRLSDQNSLSLPHIEGSEHNSPNAGPSKVPPTQERLPEHNYNEVYDIPPSKQLEFVDVCPLELRPYILEVMDVPRDGHCGFRAIASLLGYSEDTGWKRVRKDLTDELKVDNTHYVQLFGPERVNELRDGLTYYEDICREKKHWMTMPDMGHIISSCYNVVLVHLSSVQCFTFFPFRTKPTPSSTTSTPVIVTGYDREHFYQVYLKEDHPMPPPIPLPTKKRIAGRERIYEQRSKDWVELYLRRIEHFKSLQPESVSQENPVQLGTAELKAIEYIEELLLNP